MSRGCQHRWHTLPLCKVHNGKIRLIENCIIHDGSTNQLDSHNRFPISMGIWISSETEIIRHTATLLLEINYQLFFSCQHHSVETFSCIHWRIANICIIICLQTANIHGVATRDCMLYALDWRMPYVNFYFLSQFVTVLPWRIKNTITHIEAIRSPKAIY